MRERFIRVNRLKSLELASGGQEVDDLEFLDFWQVIDAQLIEPVFDPMVESPDV
jgi:hypothetical protein